MDGQTERKRTALTSAMAAVLTAERSRHGWSRADVVARSAGQLSKTTYRRMEEHTRVPSLSDLEAAAAALGVTISYLIAEAEKHRDDPPPEAAADVRKPKATKRQAAPRPTAARRRKSDGA